MGLCGIGRIADAATRDAPRTATRDLASAEANEARAMGLCGIGRIADAATRDAPRTATRGLASAEVKRAEPLARAAEEICAPPRPSRGRCVGPRKSNGELRRSSGEPKGASNAPRNARVPQIPPARAGPTARGRPGASPRHEANAECAAVAAAASGAAVRAADDNNFVADDPRASNLSCRSQADLPRAPGRTRPVTSNPLELQTRRAAAVRLSAHRLRRAPEHRRIG